MSSHDQNLAAIRAACFKVTGVDADDVFYDPGIGDVLLALGVALHRLDANVSVDMDGDVTVCRLGDCDVACHWNLRLPLSGQSEETAAYLAGLLTDAKGTE